MTNKIEIEFHQQSNYEGSQIFSSLADVIGLSVDLVSRYVDARTSLVSPKILQFQHPPQKSAQPYCERDEHEKLSAHPTDNQK